jgi:hypothetical protein
MVDLVNNEPSGTEERVLYKADVRLYTNINAFSISHNLRQVKYANPPPPAGTELLNGWLDVPCCGGHGGAVFEYDTKWPLQERGKYEIYWQKQPGTVKDKVDIVWSDGHGHTYAASGDLGQDRVITLAPTGVTLTGGRAALATLPSLSLG